jgi:hypothetical protein
VLLDQDSRRQRLRGVIVEHRHRALHDDRSGIELAGDQMHGGAADLHAVGDGLPLRLEAGKRRQQRRMDVEDRIRKRVEERRADDAHITGQAHQTDIACAQLARQRLVVVDPGRPAAMADADRLDPRRARALERAGAFDIRDHDGNRRVEASVCDRVDERLQVAAAPGDEHAETAINGVGGHF